MRKIFDNIAAVFVIGIVFLIIIPLNTMVLDAMLIFNIAFSLGILLITMYIREALEFSIFPSLLLITTLLRLSLNVSATRLILGNSGQAGQVIKTFGQFVIGGNAVVGFMIFLIIVIVQFIVITKGSERVAEVGARFTLDAMPGKQMAIDADLNSGLINDEIARSRRVKIQREADFYGSMDGASKFVKGDAIISILIVFINIIGGSVIGLLTGGKSFEEILSIYVVATVGNGLVIQLPALLISTAMGMVVTRAASENNLSHDLTKQLFSHPVSLTITGIVLLLLCFIPGMPKMELIVLGFVLVFAAAKFRKTNEKETEEEPELPMSETEFYKNPENIYTLLGVEPIEMEFGYSLIPLVDESKGGSFIDRVIMLRRQFAVDLGVVVPSVRLRDNMELSPNEYAIKLKGEMISKGEVLSDHFLVMNPSGQVEGLSGIDTVEPAFGISAKWISADKRETAQMSGYTVIDPLSVILTHLSEVIKRHAHELLGRKEVGQILQNIKKSNKELVDDTVPALISVGDVQKILCNLLEEQIPIKDMTTILETLAEYAPSVKDCDILTEYVRQALKRTITRKFTDGRNMKVVTLNPDLEDIIMSSVKKSDHGSYLSMEPDKMQKILTAHTAQIDKIREVVPNPIVLTSPVVRIYYRKLIEQFSPETVVLSFSEIDTVVQIQSLGIIAV